MAEIILVTGGARSGKSGYAQSLAEAETGTRVFIATCPPAAETGDREMAARIDRHREQRRQKGWQTIEEQLDLAGVLQDCTSHEVLLVDCLTLWVNNLLFHGSGDFSEDEIVEKGRELLAACAFCKGTVILVTNEVGLGIVPENPRAREYRDLVGRLNQVIARGADRVVLVTCGCPLTIK